MPTYPYSCPNPKCGHQFEVIKSIARIEDAERCVKCDSQAQRGIARVNFNNAGDWKPSYNPGLGRVVKSKAHQREILAEYRDKGRDFFEVGNEPVENIHKYYDTQREEKRAERWNESADQVLHETFK